MFVGVIGESLGLVPGRDVGRIEDVDNSRVDFPPSGALGIGSGSFGGGGTGCAACCRGRRACGS